MIEVGVTLGEKYRVTTVLGAGGMGLVFEAIHEELGKRVAIKALHEKFADNEEALARFVQEARAAASIGHRSIVDIYDVGVHEGSTYIVMEYLLGETLGDRLDRMSRLEINESVHVICHVLSALEAAHGRGIVHRDLKPENIFLVDSGQSMPDVKLLDFGISKIVDPTQQSELITSTGVVLGTPQFMAPEQAMGRKDVDHRADLYATGVILYQCVTGALPHMGDNPMSLLHSIITDPYAKPRTVRSDIPEELESVLIKSLEKDKDLRFPSAEAMLTELYGFLDEQSRGQVPLPSGLRVVQRSPAPTSHKESDSRDIAFESTVSPNPSDGMLVDTAIDQIGATAGPSPQKAGTPLTWSHTSRRDSWSHRRAFFAAVVLLLAVAGGVALVVVGREPQSASVAATPDPQANSHSASSAPHVSSSKNDSEGIRPYPIADSSPTEESERQTEKLVTIELEGVPDDAEVTVNGTKASGSTLAIPRSPDSSDLRVELTDGRTWEQQIIPDQSRTIRVSFGERPRRSKTTARRTASTSESTGPASENTSDRSSSETPETTEVDPEAVFNPNFD